MGRTKALIEIEGAPMAARVAAALRAAGCFPVVAVGGDDQELSALGIRVVDDMYPGEGPLGGVVSVLAQFATSADHVAVVACDMPWLAKSDVGLLVAGALEHPEIGVVVAKTNRLEPGCAIWNVGCQGLLSDLFAGGVRSLHDAIERIPSLEIAVNERSMRNINTPSDLDR